LRLKTADQANDSSEFPAENQNGLRTVKRIENYNHTPLTSTLLFNRCLLSLVPNDGRVLSTLAHIDSYVLCHNYL
jgi:hypothetical protein